MKLVFAGFFTPQTMVDQESLADITLHTHNSNYVEIVFAFFKLQKL
jgi:hypothetical protein